MKRRGSSPLTERKTLGGRSLARWPGSGIEGGAFVEQASPAVFHVPPGGGCVALAVGEHAHEWIHDAEMIGLFHCADLSCDAHAVCPGCLGSIDVALRAEAAGLVLFWCLAHGGRREDDGQS